MLGRPFGCGRQLIRGLLHTIMRESQGSVMSDDEAGLLSRLQTTSKFFDLDTRDTRQQYLICSCTDTREDTERFSRTRRQPSESQDQQVDDIVCLLVAANGGGIPGPSLDFVVVS